MQILRNSYFALKTSEDAKQKGILTKMKHHRFGRVTYLVKKIGWVT